MGSMIHILHLEDSVIDAELIQNKISEGDFNHTIFLTQTKDEFQTALTNGGIDIILADYSLPGFDGLSALKLAKERYADIPFIFVSGAMGEETAIEALIHGADDYVLKHNLSRLPSAVQRALKEKENMIRRRRAEEALKTSETNYMDLYENAPVMYMSVNTQTRLIEKCNQTLATALNRPKDLIFNRAIYDIFHPNSRGKVKETFAEFMTYGAVYNKELQLQKTDNSILEVSMNISAVYDSDGSIVSARTTLHDITERKNLEKMLQQSQRIEAIGQLAGGIAHDFNNILSSIFGYAELAKIVSAKGGDVNTELEGVMSAAYRARGLIKHLLLFSRKADILKKPLPLILLLKETIKFIKATLPSTIRLCCNIKIKSCTIFADPTQIHQVIMNLCTNAVHAMKKNGGYLDIELDEVMVQKGPDIAPKPYCKLMVKDTGHGILKQHLDRIFDPFFTTKGREEGTGLGMSIVHGIITEMEGDIQVSSEYKKGTQVEILIPKMEEETIQTVVDNHIIKNGNGRILFIDDEKYILESNAKTLGCSGFNVIPMSNPVEAISFFKKGRPPIDLVVTDYDMPGMSGIALASKIKEISPQTPVILCTGFSLDLKPEVLKKNGIAGVIMKPLILNEVLKVIHKVQS